jgi:hypothetical protein
VKKWLFVSLSAAFITSWALVLLLSLSAPQPALSGYIRDAATGEPLPGATLATPDGTCAVSGPDGRFAVYTLVPTEHYLDVRREGY